MVAVAANFPISMFDRAGGGQLIAQHADIDLAVAISPSGQYRFSLMLGSTPPPRPDLTSKAAMAGDNALVVVYSALTQQQVSHGSSQSKEGISVVTTSQRAQVDHSPSPLPKSACDRPGISLHTLIVIDSWKRHAHTTLLATDSGHGMV